LGLTRLQVKPNLSLVVGSGANTAFLVTDAGVVVVGAKESEQAGRELREVIAGVTRQPVRYLIDPNHQARYTHGSTIFPRAAVIVAHERARGHMLEPPESEYWTGLAAPYMPDMAVTDHVTLYLGGTPVEVIHPGRGHTDGDLIVFFPDQHTIHMGDLFWNRRLPFIDRRHGGSVLALVSTLQRVLAIPGVETFIPGYGDVGTRADVQREVALLRDLQAQVRRAIAQRRTRAQTIGSLPIPTYARSAGTEAFGALVGTVYDELAPTPALNPTRNPNRNRNLNPNRKTSD
jgi:glyoxylase-like metal-dependent hydrolase (beta-lactamase superfamily II)